MSDSKDFIRDVGSLSLLNMFSSFINIFGFFLVTNILGPIEYGKYSFVIYLITTVSLSAYGAVNEALLRFSAITKDKKLIKHCIKIQYAFGFIALFGFLVFSQFIDRIYGKPLSLILVITSFSFLFTPLVESFKNLTVGRKNIKGLIYISLTNQLLFIGLAIGLYLSNFKTSVAMGVIYLIASFFNFLQAKNLLDKMRYHEDGKYNKKELNNYIKRGLLFGLFKNIFFQSALIFGSKFIDAASIGYYTFSISIATVSIFAITSAISLITVPYITTFYEKSQISKVNSYFNASIKLGLLISIVASLMLYFFLKVFLKYLFPKYVDSLAIIPYIFIAFTLLNFNVTSSFLKARGHINILTKTSIITTVFSLIDSYTLSRFFGLNGMVISLILNILFTCAINWHYTNKKLGLTFMIIPNQEEIRALKLYLNLILVKIKNVLWFR